MIHHLYFCKKFLKHFSRVKIDFTIGFLYSPEKLIIFFFKTPDTASSTIIVIHIALLFVQTCIFSVFQFLFLPKLCLVSFLMFSKVLCFSEYVF